MNNGILEHYVDEFRAGSDLKAGDTAAFFDAIMAETDEPLIADLLNSWEVKGTTEDELFELASLMRKRMRRIASEIPGIIDIVGTGGSRSKTFNISTAAAFVIAGAGLPVAKHGNRAATSNSGNADVLEQLGICPDIDPVATETCLAEHGICFMFAPRFHSLSPTLASVRRKLRKPTIFNNIGPLCNPAGAEHQVIGVWHGDRLIPTGAVLNRLGTGRSWVVHSESGLDEIDLAGETYIAEVFDGEVASRTISAVDFGINGVSGIVPASLSAGESAFLIREILNNRLCGEDVENLVLINAASAIYVAGRAADLGEAFEMAEGSVRSRAALGKLSALADATHK